MCYILLAEDYVLIIHRFPEKEDESSIRSTHWCDLHAIHNADIDEVDFDVGILGIV